MFQELAVAAAFAIGTLSANADVIRTITFDDVTVNLYDPIPNGYAGFNWGGYLTDGSTPTAHPEYPASAVSGLYGIFSNPGSGIGFSSTTPFKLISMSVASAVGYGRYDECMYFGPSCPPLDSNIYIRGLKAWGGGYYEKVVTSGGLVSFSDWTIPVLGVGIELNYDSVELRGLVSADNIIVSAVPLPTSALMLGAALLGMLGIGRKQRNI